jgi:hypothetical protein
MDCGLLVHVVCGMVSPILNLALEFNMARSSVVRCALVFALLLAGTVRPANAQTSTANSPLSLEDVVKDWKTGIAEELIITKIRKNGRAFNLSSEEIRELTNAGITPNVVKYLLDPSQPLPPPPPTLPVPALPAGQPAAAVPAVRTPPRTYPADPHANDVPPDPGLYRFVSDTPMKTEVKLLLGEQQGAGVGRVLLKKGKAIGYLLEQTTNTRISEALPVFYLRLLEGKAIEEVVLLALRQTKDRREIELGESLDKPVLKSDSMRAFDSLEVGPGVFRITPKKNLVKGEYVFFLRGSAEPPKGSVGKLYDFSIEGPRK